MSGDQSDAQAVAEAKGSQVVGRVYRIVDALRETADRIERCATAPPTNLRTTLPDYGRLAAEAQHAFLWMVPNLELDGLTRDAADAAAWQARAASERGDA